jgi:hypothetical protein
MELPDVEQWMENQPYTEEVKGAVCLNFIKISFLVLRSRLSDVEKSRMVGKAERSVFHTLDLALAFYLF